VVNVAILVKVEASLRHNNRTEFQHELFENFIHSNRFLDFPLPIHIWNDDLCSIHDHFILRIGDLALPLSIPILKSFFYLLFRHL
jgi:hypothetical protein